MKVNLDKQFKGIDGKAIQGETMRELLARGLFAGNGVGNGEADKFAAYKLCNRLINERGEMEFDKDERKLLRAVACACLTPGAYGQIVELIKD